MNKPAAALLVLLAFTAEAHDDGVSAEPEAPEAPEAAEAPPARPEAAAPEKTEAPNQVTTQSPQQQTTVSARRPAKSASSLSIKREDDKLRPLRSAADLLDVAPGLVTVQTAGGAKANQYFLRGFDIDHGTDLALSLDGVPVNLPSHAHGQGYADLNFVIPELVERVEVNKGPYAAKDGDFATAGSINLVSADHVHHNEVKLTAGNFGSYRALLLAAPPPGEHVDGYLGADVFTTNGPFENAEHLRRYIVNARAAVRPSSGVELSLSLQSYMAGWNASGAIPLRLIESGQVSRFGSLSPTDGGDTMRHALNLTLRANDVGGGRLSITGYGIRYGLDLYSNFSLYSADPVNGDQIRQVDLRTVTGLNAQYQKTFALGPVSLGSTTGVQVRSDVIDNALSHVAKREALGELTRAHVAQQTFGVFTELDAGFTRWLRVIGGVRADGFHYALDDKLDRTASGDLTTALVSPKAAVIVTPHEWVSVFGNVGRGFHSNDARALQAPTVATSYEVGTRFKPSRALEVGLVAWGMNLDSELVWVGDEGHTESSGSSHRRGLELDAKVRPMPWLTADVAGTLSEARFDNGDFVPLAPIWTLSAGVTAQHPIGVFGAVRWTQVGARPANEDGSIQARPMALLDASVGYTFGRFTAALEGLNLLNTNWYEAQFVSSARGPGESTASDGLHVTPGNPLQVRGSLSVRLD